jgi:hypothetical protein
MGSASVATGEDTGPDLFICDTAWVILAPEIVCHEGALLDTKTGARYQANIVGAQINELLVCPTPVRVLRQELTSTFRMTDSSLQRDLHTFLSDLHDRRLISIKQSFVREFAHRVAGLGALLFSLVCFYQPPIRNRYPNRRYKASGTNIIVRSIEAHQPTMIIGAVIFAAFWLLQRLQSGSIPLPWNLSVHVGRLPDPGAADRADTVILLYVAVLIISGMVHELAHYLVAHHLGVPVRTIFVRMFVTGMSHHKTGEARTMVIALVGPLAALIFLLAVAISVLMSDMSIVYQFLTCLVLCAVALQHAASLTPFSADGRLVLHSLLQAIRRRRSSGESVGVE